MVVWVIVVVVGCARRPVLRPAIAAAEVDFASDVCSLSAATVVRGSPNWSSAVSAARDRRIRELEPAAREHYAERWGAPQPNFVDQPAHAVAEADALVSEVVRERAYPVANDFESERPPPCRQPSRGRGALSRRARDLDPAPRRATPGTEHLRQAMVHFRALFDEL